MRTLKRVLITFGLALGLTVATTATAYAGQIQSI
jgi:hypothetical protein